MFEKKTVTQQEVYAIYDVDEMSKLKDEAILQDFVRFLNPERQQRLTKWLSEWRNNSVRHGIDGHRGIWQQEFIDVERIIIAPINKTVNHLLERHQNRLHLIAKDAEVINHPEFSVKGEISRSVFIAERVGSDFRLVDGNHRAVALTASGETRLCLVYPG